MPPNLSDTTKYYAEERQWKQRLASIQVQPQVPSPTQFQPEVILKEKCITQNLNKRERKRNATTKWCTDAGEGRVGLPCLREDGALFRMSVKG